MVADQRYVHSTGTQGHPSPEVTFIGTQQANRQELDERLALTIRKREDNARGGGFLIGAGAGLFVGFALGFLVTWAVL